MNDGGPAFPAPEGSLYAGMTLRQWYAGMALQGLLASETESYDYPKTSTMTRYQRAAGEAFCMADAMLQQEATP